MMQLMITEAIEEGLLDGYRSVKEFSNLDEPTLLGLVKIKGGKSAQIYDQLLRRKLWKVVEERIVKAEQQSQILEELYLLHAPCHIDVPEKLSLISPWIVARCSSWMKKVWSCHFHTTKKRLVIRCFNRK